MTIQCPMCKDKAAAEMDRRKNAQTITTNSSSLNDTLRNQCPRTPSNLPYAQADQVTAIPIQRTKGWQDTVTPSERNVWVGRLAHVMVTYAQRMEAHIYEIANNSLDYRHLCKEESHWMPKKLETRWQKKKEGQEEVDMWVKKLSLPVTIGTPVIESESCYATLSAEARLVNNESGFMLPAYRLAAIPIEGTKEWHQEVTPEERHHLVRILADELIAFARRVERDTYRIMANCRYDYCYLLSKEIYKLHKKLERRIRI